MREKIKIKNIIIFSAVLVIFVILLFSVCKIADSEAYSPADKANAGISAAAENEQGEEPYDPNDIPAYKLPDNWTLEKVCSLIEIDGNPIKFPCTVEEFQKTAEGITVGEPDSVFGYCDIYYNDVKTGTFALDSEKQLSEFIYINFYDFENYNIINEMTFAGFTGENVDDINNFMNENCTVSSEIKYNDDGSHMSLKTYVFDANDVNYKMELAYYHYNDDVYLAGIILKIL